MEEQNQSAEDAPVVADPSVEMLTAAVMAESQYDPEIHAEAEAILESRSNELNSDFTPITPAERLAQEKAVRKDFEELMKRVIDTPEARTQFIKLANTRHEAVMRMLDRAAEAIEMIRRDAAAVPTRRDMMNVIAFTNSEWQDFVPRLAKVFGPVLMSVLTQECSKANANGPAEHALYTAEEQAARQEQANQASLIRQLERVISERIGRNSD